MRALRLRIMQAALYQACVAAGITLLSIGHRPAIKAFHQAVIHFEVPTLPCFWHPGCWGNVPEANPRPCD